MIKVKVHRGDPLNEEADIRAEMGRLKEENEKTWTTQTDRTIYQWSEPSKNKKGTLITKTSAWTHAVRNRMRQKVGEIQVFRAFERGVEKWCCYESRRRERIHEDGSFMYHQKGSITATYTSDWNLREGEYRGKLGE